MKNSMKKLALVAATSALLFACHGNDSDGSDPTPNPSSKTVSGKLIDGPIKGMGVCADINKDGDCAANEPSAVSGDDGSFVINDIPADTNLTGLPLVAKAGSNAVDTVTNKNLAGLVLEVLLVTQEDPTKEVIMTPLKKLVADKLKASDAPKLGDAIKAVADETGLTPEELLANPAAANASEKVKKAAQIVAGILIKSQEKLDAAKAKIDSKNLSAAQEAKADEKVEEKVAENTLDAAAKALKDLKDDTNVEEAINDVEVEAISDKEVDDIVKETSGAAQA